MRKAKERKISRNDALRGFSDIIKFNFKDMCSSHNIEERGG